MYLCVDGPAPAYSAKLMSVKPNLRKCRPPFSSMRMEIRHFDESNTPEEEEAFILQRNEKRALYCTRWFCTSIRLETSLKFPPSNWRTLAKRIALLQRFKKWIFPLSAIKLKNNERTVPVSNFRKLFKAQVDLKLVPFLLYHESHFNFCSLSRLQMRSNWEQFGQNCGKQAALEK